MFVKGITYAIILLNKITGKWRREIDGITDIVQQLALATYKSKQPDQEISLLQPNI